MRRVTPNDGPRTRKVRLEGIGTDSFVQVQHEASPLTFRQFRHSPGRLAVRSGHGGQLGCPTVPRVSTRSQVLSRFRYSGVPKCVNLDNVRSVVARRFRVSRVDMMPRSPTGSVRLWPGKERITLSAAGQSLALAHFTLRDLGRVFGQDPHLSCSDRFFRRRWRPPLDKYASRTDYSSARISSVNAHIADHAAIRYRRQTTCIGRPRRIDNLHVQSRGVRTEFFG
jgi:hypothetical protein